MALLGETEGAPRPVDSEPLRAHSFTWIGSALVAAAFAAMTWWTWGTWPDVVVDFGRELYVPWRLTQGAELYRDVAWFNGPLSAWFNAALFDLFGASLRTLVIANLVLFGLLVALVFALLRAISDPLAATAGALVLVFGFGFGQLVRIGNYNFVCPYSHEITHGLLLGLAALGCLRRWNGQRGGVWVALAGLCLGLCFLTKAEVFLAALLGSGTLLVLILWSEPAARASRGPVLLLASAFAPVLLAFLVLAADLPAAQALRATLGSWPWVLGGGAEELHFYRRWMGLTAPAARLGELFAWSARWLLLLAPSAVLALALRRRSRAAPAAAVAALIGTGGALLALSGDLRWLQAMRPLPLFVILLGVAFAWRLARDPQRRRAGRTELALCVFALVLLGKMLLFARLFNYGFALAMPATLLVVTALVGWLPARLDARGRAGDVLRAAAVALIAVGIVGHLGIVKGLLANKEHVVGQGADAFRADRRGRIVNEALKTFDRLAEPGDTLAVLPEGVMLNWLARSANPTPYVNFMPPELLLFGEEHIVAAFEAAPPDFVMLVHKDTSEYGFQFFGADYGGTLAGWIHEHYVPVRRFGQPPLQPKTLFGIALLRRR